MATIFEAPEARKTAMNRQPMAPAPNTTADSPGRIAARFVPLTTQASGSTSAASSAGTSSEMGYTLLAGAVT